jgi:hypothetical protein
MDTLTDPAPVTTEHDTEPMPVVRTDGPEHCGVEDCGQSATPFVYCRSCHMPLCVAHTGWVMATRGVATACPECKGDK